jgi:Cu+-exporting ATPase
MILVRDPVCGAVLDEKTAKFRINFEGETYYFCSASCKEKIQTPSKEVR